MRPVTLIFMEYKYQVKIYKAGERYQDGTAGPARDLDAAFAMGRTLAADSKNKSVQILRADCDGINAGKFFLHQIIK